MMPSVSRMTLCINEIAPATACPASVIMLGASVYQPKPALTATASPTVSGESNPYRTPASKLPATAANGKNNTRKPIVFRFSTTVPESPMLKPTRPSRIQMPIVNHVPDIF